MDYLRILWDDPADPNGNVQHILDHGLSIEDVEDVLENPTSEARVHPPAVLRAWGYTLEGLYVIIVYDETDEDTIRVRTAYEVPEPR